MRTTVVLDDELVARARDVLGGPSLRAMIESSLRYSIRRRGLEAIRRELGTFELPFAEQEFELSRGHRLAE